MVWVDEHHQPNPSQLSMLYKYFLFMLQMFFTLSNDEKDGQMALLLACDKLLIKCAHIIL